MLTADLALSWQRGDQIKPRYINTEDEEHLREAEDLVALFAEHEGRVRAALEESLQEYVGTGTDYKTLRGLIKLLNDRCEFETSAPAEPVEIRQKVFLEARKSHPILPGSVAKEKVLETVAEEFLSDKNAIEANL